MILKLWPLALGVAAAWLIVRWRDARAAVTSAGTAPAAPGAGWTAPAASGSASDDYAFPMVQAPGTFDEFSTQPVNMGGDLSGEPAASPPSQLATVTLVDEPPLALRDTVSAMPVAEIEDTFIPSTRAPAPVFSLPPLRTEPRLEPDHARPALELYRAVGPATPAPTSGPGSSTVPGHVVQPLAGGGVYIGAPGKDPQKVAARIIEKVKGKPPPKKGGKKGGKK